ncbi:MAG: FAD-dependent oxidoreductase [Candidatus Binatia bacterium]
MQLDVLIFGAGAAGLWCLDRFRRAGYHAILLEARALGAGQTIRAQGIIHGGGKYALRGVRDFAAVRATSEMPERWRRCLASETEPDLAATQVLSDRCYLWLPRGSFAATVQSFGFMPLLAKAGLLATRPEKLPQPAWPEALRASAVVVYALAEPVVSTGSFLQTLAAQHEGFIFLYDATRLHISEKGVQTAEVTIKPRAIVLAAGAGNAELARAAGIEADLMQRRPLKMVLLRGALPPLFGHCIAGGKTQLTITAAAPGLWQAGGEIAERLAEEKNNPRARQKALRAIRRCLPGLDLSGAEIALYEAVRAEARTADLRRPSGVHVSRVAPGVIVAWPTKLSLTPVLADEVFALVNVDLKNPAGYNQKMLPQWPKPSLARYPWEEIEWFPAR